MLRNHVFISLDLISCFKRVESSFSTRDRLIHFVERMNIFMTVEQLVATFFCEYLVHLEQELQKSGRAESREDCDVFNMPLPLRHKCMPKVD